MFRHYKNSTVKSSPQLSAGTDISSVTVSQNLCGFMVVEGEFYTWSN